MYQGKKKNIFRKTSPIHPCEIFKTDTDAQLNQLPKTFTDKNKNWNKMETLIHKFSQSHWRFSEEN